MTQRFKCGETVYITDYKLILARERMDALIRYYTPPIFNQGSYILSGGGRIGLEVPEWILSSSREEAVAQALKDAHDAVNYAQKALIAATADLERLKELVNHAVPR